MHFNPLGFIELFVVLLFAAAWGILELVARRLDKQRRAKDASGPVAVADGERKTKAEERP